MARNAHPEVTRTRILDAAQMHLDGEAMGQRHADGDTFAMHEAG